MLVVIQRTEKVSSYNKSGVNGVCLLKDQIYQASYWKYDKNEVRYTTTKVSNSFEEAVEFRREVEKRRNIYPR